MPTYSDEVLVLGAGAAGIGCGERLRELGVPFTILEARDRVGGRAVTDTALVPGFPLELGAQMIHGRHVLTHRWARELGLTVRRWPVSQRALLSVGGRLCRFPWLALPGYPNFGTRAFVQAAWALPRKLQEAPEPDLSLSAFLDREAKSPGARRWVELLYAHVYAAAPEEVGVRGPAEEQQAATEAFGYRNFRLNEGYSTLFYRRSQPFRERIRLGVRVHAVHYDSNGVRVEAESVGSGERRTLSGRAAVVTLPIGVLKSGDIQFDPSLPANKREAIRRIGSGMGYALQLRMAGHELRDRWGDFSMVWAGGASTFHRPGVGQRGLPEVLTAFTVGPEAARRATLSSPDRLAATLEELSAALPRSTSVGEVGSTSCHLWPVDPYARGAYSFLPPGVRLRDRHTLAEPVGESLFFAGEATHGNGESATVHGAIETGRRAAEEVFNQFRPESEE